MNIISNCPLCEEKSLHIIGENETQTQQCINCGYATAEKFKIDKIEDKEKLLAYARLTDDMKKWSKISNDRVWIPTIMTLPIGMLYPSNVDNMVNHKTEMKWSFAPMVKITEEEKENFPKNDGSGGFYEKRIDTDNPKVYDKFVDAMVYINDAMKKESNKSTNSIKLNPLPKLKKM